MTQKDGGSGGYGSNLAHVNGITCDGTIIDGFDFIDCGIKQHDIINKLLIKKTKTELFQTLLILYNSTTFRMPIILQGVL